jgi:hypothetical protein
VVSPADYSMDEPTVFPFADDNTGYLFAIHLLA